MNSISVNEEFISNVKAILVVSDKDDDPEKSFTEVRAEIGKVSGLPIPDQDGVIAANKNGGPHVAVLMLPISENGNLETLCLIAANHKWGLDPHLDTFISNTPAKDWGKSKQSKARIHAVLASTNSDQPDAGFASHWAQDQKFQIPLDHTCFDELANFLDSFPDLVEANNSE